jgi:hypothetical protein
MKQTTKPNTKQSHLKRDLAGNVAALPLPTPPSGERGEGAWAGSPSMNLEFPQFQEIAARRDEPLSLSFVIDNQSPITDYRLQTYDLIRVVAV